MKVSSSLKQLIFVPTHTHTNPSIPAAHTRGNNFKYRIAGYFIVDHTKSLSQDFQRNYPELYEYLKYELLTFNWAVYTKIYTNENDPLYTV